MRIGVIIMAFAGLCAPALGADQPRARDLGVPFDGTPGPLNAITDVAGVEVGHKTITRGDGKLKRGKGPVRTGVTAILPRGRTYDPVFAGWHALNGNGEMTGTTWITESGFLEGPIMLTNTHSVGVVHDAVIEWQVRHKFYEGLPGEPEVFWSLPIVAETWDGDLNDINGFHVTKKDAFDALDAAKPGPVAEGNVGGGTGMITHEFKGGVGTASRVLESETGGYTVGALVQSNYGIRKTMRIAGAPVGAEIPDLLPGTAPQAEERGSIIVVIATDAPLLPHQLRRLAQRASLALGRMGSYASNSSGDIFIAFSTANPKAAYRTKNQTVEFIPNDSMGPIFLAAVEATEEAIVNALVAAETMTGANGYTVHELPHDRLQAALKKYGRLVERTE
ncbi:MAG: P1 family peptidase [Pseudomonadota bacterium]